MIKRILGLILLSRLKLSDCRFVGVGGDRKITGGGAEDMPISLLFFLFSWEMGMKLGEGLKL